MTVKAERGRRSARNLGVERVGKTDLNVSTALAVRMFGFSRLMVTVVDEQGRHLIVAGDGPGSDKLDPYASSLCDSVVEDGRPAVIDPSRPGSDAVLGTNLPPVSGTYLAVPLIGPESWVIGTICAVDPGSGVTAAAKLTPLLDFARIVQDQLDLARRLEESELHAEFAVRELSEALESGQFVPWYQPVVDLATDRVVGYEALARWQHPSGEVDGAHKFIDLAEGSDLIVGLDLAVMRRAFLDLSRWQQNDPALRMSVNLSGRQFESDRLPTVVHEAAVAAGLDPRSIDLELTETTRVRDSAKLSAVTRQLKTWGFQVWFDDFGTGWSSLEHLLQVPIDGIKVDRSFVASLDHHIGRTVTRAVVATAKELRLKVTMEGIETSEQAVFARSTECDFGQGFLWSAARPGAEIDQIRGSG